MASTSETANALGTAVPRRLVKCSRPSIKAFIRQEEQNIITRVKDENSQYAFHNDAIQIGGDTWRNVGYGRWQGAVYVTMT